MTERLHFHFSLSCIGEGNGNPLQYSCLENPRNWGSHWAAVYGVTQSRTRLKWLSSSSSSKHLCYITLQATLKGEHCCFGTENWSHRRQRVLIKSHSFRQYSLKKEKKKKNLNCSLTLINYIKKKVPIGKSQWLKNYWVIFIILPEAKVYFVINNNHTIAWSVSSKVNVAQSCLTLCDPMDCSLPGSSVHGIFQARVLEWVAISFSRRSSQPRDRTQVSCVVGRRFTIWATREVSLCDCKCVFCPNATYYIQNSFKSLPEQHTFKPNQSSLQRTTPSRCVNFII